MPGVAAGIHGGAHPDTALRRYRLRLIERPVGFGDARNIGGVNGQRQGRLDETDYTQLRAPRFREVVREAIDRIVAEHGLPMIQEYEAHCRSSGIVLPPGAAPWPWFVKNLREAMNQPWKWRDNGNGSGGRGPQIQLTELDRMQIQADREREEATRRGDQRTTDGTRDPRPTL